MDIKKNTEQYDKSVRELVATRLETLPEDSVVSFGADGEFTKKQLIESVHKGNTIGQKMVELEMSFLQGLKDGILYGETSVNN